MNPNIKNILWICCLSGFYDSLWTLTILVAYTDLFMGEPKYVGIVEACRGLSSLLTAIPIGYLSDKYGRSRIVHFGVKIIIVACIA